MAGMYEGRHEEDSGQLVEEDEGDEVVEGAQERYVAPGLVLNI